MTRKDYELIAVALKRALLTAGVRTGAAKGVVDCINKVGLALANENPRFDRDRFNQACGIGGGE